MATLNFLKLLAVDGKPVVIDSNKIYDKATKKSLAEYISANDTRVAGLEAALAGKAPVDVVADITARDALTNVLHGALVWVKDASDDPTVVSGAAAYLAEVSGDPATVTWSKVSEAESMDVVLQWANIQGKPSSAVADIDDAVTKRHEHDNKTVLDGISTNVETGNLVYNNVELNGETGIAMGATLEAATSYTSKLQIVLEEYDPDTGE